MTTPNAEQLEALQRYALKHGRCWKGQLVVDWMTGRDEQKPDSHLLRQLRNTLGPKRLTKFKLPKAP